MNKKPTTAGSGLDSEPVIDSLHSVLSPESSTPTLLAVDCGLRTGLALFDLSGKLLWYRSHNLAKRARLKRVAWKLLKETDGLCRVVVEGGGPFAEIWQKTAERQGLEIRQVYAEEWREALLLPRQQRTGKQAKQVADELARKVIEDSGLAKPTSLRHDAAEAILIGRWACFTLKK